MFKDENRHYSLRKLSVGLASVLIGISFVSGNNHTVKADTVKDGSNGAQTVVQTTADDSNAVAKSHDTAIKVDAKDGANVAAKANAESTPEEQSQTPEAVKKDFDTITQDIRQKAIKASEAAIKVQNNTVKDNSDETTLNAKGSEAVAESMTKEDKTEAKENQGWTDSAENKPQMSTLGPTTNKKLNATNDTNGGNVTTQTTNLQAIRVINFVYPDGYTGKKQDSITQTVDVPQKAKENPDPVYFEDYTVPEIKGLLEPDKTVISKQQADINKPINVTVTYKLVESNTNDAFALDSKNGLHEHANVNDNGGYDADYWGKINVDDWNYTTNGNTITIKEYKGTNPASVIIPNGADFGFIDGNIVEINKYVILQLARTATRIGISKTANNKVAVNTADLSNVFYNEPNLMQMDLHNLDTSNVTNMSHMFSGASRLTTIGDLSKWDTSNVTNMSYMFSNASSLTNIGDLSKWDTSKVTNMSYMFSDTSHLTNIGKLNNWDTSKVTDMQHMFANASSLTNIGELNNWDTSKVTNMSYMFSDTSRLTNIGELNNWDTSKVTNMRHMFSNASSLATIGKLNNWNTSKVTDMQHMFANASSLTNIGELNNWNTSKVTDMSYMFSDASSLTNIGKLNNWDTSKVTNMSYMFCVLYGKVSSLTNIGDLSKWNTSKVTNMSFMFANASRLTNIGELNNWDTSKVTNMRSMFANASSLIDLGDLSKWNTSKVTNMSYMFSSAKALRYLNISNWDLTKLANKNAMNAMFRLDTDLTVIANNVKLPTWYQTKITDAKYVWSNNMAVITNVPELIESTGAIDNLKIDDQDASRSIFYDSKGSSDAVQVLKDANQAYINKYEQDHPKYLLALVASVDQTDPIALANAKFTLSHKLIDVVQTDNATRTIIVHLPNGTTQTIVQTIGLKRNAQKDLVTEIISSTAPWELDAANSSFTINGVEQTQTAYKQNSNIITFSSITLPKVPGYKANVTRNNGLLMVSYLALAPEKPETNNNLNDLQFSDKLATNSTVQFNSTVESNIVVKSDMYQVVNEDHNWQLPVIKNYDLKFATNKNQIIFAYTKDKQYNYRFVLTFKDGQYRLATFDKQGTLLKTYSIKSYKKLAKIIHFLVSTNIA